MPLAYYYDLDREHSTKSTNSHYLLKIVNMPSGIRTRVNERPSNRIYHQPIRLCTHCITRIVKVSGPCVETSCFLMYKNIINAEMWV